MKITPKKLLVIALIVFILGLLLACSKKDDPTALTPNTVGCYTVGNGAFGRVNVGEELYWQYQAQVDSSIAKHRPPNDPKFTPGACKW